MLLDIKTDIADILPKNFCAELVSKLAKTSVISDSGPQRRLVAFAGFRGNWEPQQAWVKGTMNAQMSGGSAGRSYVSL